MYHMKIYKDVSLYVALVGVFVAIAFAYLGIKVYNENYSVSWLGGCLMWLMSLVLIGVVYTSIIHVMIKKYCMLRNR